MTVRYNIPVKALNPDGKREVSGTHYFIFRDDQDKQQERVFHSERTFPYLGKMVVVHAFSRDVAQKTYSALKSLERTGRNIIVLPITESDFEEDQARDSESELARILGPHWNQTGQFVVA